MEYTYGSRNLKKGDSGEDVRALQIKLVMFGKKNSPVPCDGQFDQSTEDATVNFCKYFNLQESIVVNETIYETIDNWAEKMKPTMTAFLNNYKCKCQSRKSSPDFPNMTKLWNDHVKNKCLLISGSKAGDPTCIGFGNNLTQVILTNNESWTYKSTSTLTENGGIDIVLFWAILGLHKIYETKIGASTYLPIINVHNGYRCNLDYFSVSAHASHGASMGNHVGLACDFHIDIPNQGKINLHSKSELKTYNPVANRIPHCNQIKDDLLNIGIVETLDTQSTKNTSRIEPRSKSPGWVHMDSSVYKFHKFVKSVDEAILPKAGMSSTEQRVYSLPIDITSGLDVTSDSLSKLYKHNEKEFPGGFFPIGGNTVWHGGIHLKPSEDKPVCSMMAGKVIAVRLSDDSSAAMKHYGSRNFILTEHTFKSKPFYCLYMHLGLIKLNENDTFVKNLQWIKKAGGQSFLDGLKDGAVVKCNAEIHGGETLWKTGEYGSPQYRKKLLHWEIFANENLFVLLDTNQSTPQVHIEGDTGWTIDKGLRVVTVAGPSSAYVDDKIICVIKKCSFKDALADEYNKINWVIESNGHAVEKFENHGLKLEYKVPGSLAGKPIKIKPYMNSPSDSVVVTVNISQGKKPEFIVIEDNDNDYNVDNAKILKLFPADITSDGLITTEELNKFYKENPNGNAEKLRYTACKFASEWGISDLEKAISAMKGRWTTWGLKDKIEPYLWWKEAVNAGVKIPSNPHVWHFHPLKFLEVVSGVREVKYPTAGETVPKSEQQPVQPPPFNQNTPNDANKSEIELADARLICLKCTAVFEGAWDVSKSNFNFGVIAPNFDLAGLSIGIIQWNIKSQNFFPLLLLMKNKNPEEFKKCYNENHPERFKKYFAIASQGSPISAVWEYESFIKFMEESNLTDQYLWAKLLHKPEAIQSAEAIPKWRTAKKYSSAGKALVPELIDFFCKLGEIKAFQDIQIIEAWKRYGQSAINQINWLKQSIQQKNSDILKKVELRTLAALFDLCVQQGSLNTTTKNEILKNISNNDYSSQNEFLKMVVIERAKSSSAEWQNNAASRRLGFLNASPTLSSNLSGDPYTVKNCNYALVTNNPVVKGI